MKVGVGAGDCVGFGHVNISYLDILYQYKYINGKKKPIRKELYKYP